MTANMAPWPVLSGAGEGDDHETLNAALAFVDEFELIEIEPIQVVQHDGHAHRTAAARPCGLSVESATAPSSTGKRSSNRSRTRQKDELVYLRSKVEELEGRLQELKHRHEDKDGKGEAHAREPLAFIWEELAARQYQQRQRAEVENVKLKTMLEEQIRVAKNLERLLKKRSMAELLLVPSSHKRVRKWNDTSPLDQPTVFDELMTTLTEMREQVESVFSDERFHCKTPALRDIQARSDEDLGTIVEVFDSRIAPFPLDDIADAVWHHMVKQAFELNSNYQRIVEVTGDTFMREYGADVDMPRFKGSFRGKIVAKRYMEKDRMILLWAALVDPEKVSEMPMDGLLMRQKGWTIVKNPPVDFVQADRPAALTQTYHVIVPEIDEVEGADHRRKVGTLTNFVLNSVDFHLDMGRQMIENLLLGTGWKTPSTTSSPECVVETNGAGREEIDQW